MKFLHAADLHIDSPLRGLEAYEGAPVERIRNATRESFDNLISLAIDEQVDFVILAGDLFDGKWRDMSTGLWTANQFRRLDQVNIPVYLIRGNHDAASEVRRAVAWPKCVREFSVDQAQTIVDEKLGVALHGQGFAQREVTENLSARYPERLGDLFNIGVLHTCLTGDTQHSSYAPTNENLLVQKGYDYWALGHIHDRRVIRNEHPYIHFSGNTQGRHINEPGAKGGLIVTVDDCRVQSVQFHATDVVRWQRIDVPLRLEDHVDDLLAAVRSKLHEFRRQCEGRMGAVRIAIRGACEAHKDLHKPGRASEVTAEIRNLANEFGDELWIERLCFETSMPIDLEKLQHSSTLMGDLLQLFESIQEDEDELLQLAEELRPLDSRAHAELNEAGVDLHDPALLKEWLQKAEGMLYSQLWGNA